MKSFKIVRSILDSAKEILEPGSFSSSTLMDEPIEELDPLFDYSRVQPYSVAWFDDDSLDSPTTSCRKKQKTTDAAVGKGNENVEVVNVLDEDIEDEDWLPPPPKVTIDPTMFKEDSTIKELRLMKQQLAEFTESAEDVFQAMEESVRQELASTSATECKQKAGPSCQRAKIVISVQDRSDIKQYRVFMDDKFEKFFKMYAEKRKFDLQNLVFCFDGDRISPTATPSDLGMEDNDIIEVHLKRK